MEKVERTCYPPKNHIIKNYWMRPLNKTMMFRNPEEKKAVIKS